LFGDTILITTYGVKRMESPTRWIDINNHLPEPGQKVLTFFRQDKKAFIMTSSINELNEWNISEPIFCIDKKPLTATHWMPLP